MTDESTMMISPGMYPTLTNEEYHGYKQAISRSALMDFKKNPRHYWAMHLNPNRPARVETPAMTFGTAFHTLILEPFTFDNRYAIEPKKVLLKEVGEEKYRVYKMECEQLEKTNKIVLSHADYSHLINMQSCLLSNSQAKELIEGAIYESSYFWPDKESGLNVKARPDILHHNMYIDLKTIDDASPHNFQRSMVMGGYHIQAAMVEDAVMYFNGNKLAASINICIEKKYPYSIGIYIIDEESIEHGRKEYKKLLVDLKSAIVHNEFEDYEIQTVGLPKWYL